MNEPLKQYVRAVELIPAGLGPRSVAALIDIVIISALSYVIYLPFAKIYHLGDLQSTLMKQMSVLQTDPGGMDPAMMSSLMRLIIGVSVLLLVLLFLMHAYYVYFEASESGQTPGKKMLGLRVVTLTGGRITHKQAVYREMLRWYFDGLFIVPALIAIYSTPRRQRVGDILAKTFVIETPRSP